MSSRLVLLQTPGDEIEVDIGPEPHRRRKAVDENNGPRMRICWTISPCRTAQSLLDHSTLSVGAIAREHPVSAKSLSYTLTYIGGPSRRTAGGGEPSFAMATCHGYDMLAGCRRAVTSICTVHPFEPSRKAKHR